MPIEIIVIIGIIICVAGLAIVSYFLQKQKWKVDQQKSNLYAKELELKRLKESLERETVEAREEMEKERALLYQQTINELEQIKEQHRENTLREVAAEAEREYNRQIALMTEEKDRYIQYLNSELEEDSESFISAVNVLRSTADKMESEVQDVASRLVSLIEAEKTLLDEQRQKIHQLALTREDANDLRLLTEEILPRIRRQDIIRKLIWVEYIQQPTGDLVNSIFPPNQPGIYKITNIKNKKSYIGRSVNTRSRIVEHIKSSLGLGSIADQAIHHAMREEGLENFMFELLEDCEKEQLAEREKYYIKLFQSQEHGYNKNVGG